ncbi:MAG: hypothetical protein M3265_01540 [Actinomycetota bacterium]|nr:hypothetical protein [Actinomycetota bacterium]
MDEAVAAAAAGSDAYVVGGAVRDELLGRPVVDVDVVCADPQAAARAYARQVDGAAFMLSERHGAWRVAFRDGRTVDFMPLLDGIESDLRTRDFTINAIARRIAAADYVDPLRGRRDLEARLLRAVTPGIFRDDPLRLLRAVRLEDELRFRLEPETERILRSQADLVTQPAGERILGELHRLSVAGFARLHELGLLERLGGNVRGDGAGRIDSSAFRLVWFLGKALEALPISNELRRYARTLLRARCPQDASPRAVHRFRRTTEPWALDALALWQCDDELVRAVEAARASEPAGPLLRGDELEVPPGPEVGRLLDRIAEERAAGTITTREEALDLVRREARNPGDEPPIEEA